MVRQMLPKEGHLLLLVGPTRTRRRRRLVGLEHSPIRDHPSVVGRKSAPRIKIRRENVSTAELMVIGRENCTKYLSELKNKKKGKYDLLVLEACLVEDDTVGRSFKI